MESRGLDVEALHFLIRHDDPLGIRFVVEFASNRQAGFGGRGGDQFDDDAIADQRFGAPVLSDEGEQAGIVVSDQEMQSLNIQPADFRGEWNYTIAPSNPNTKALD